MSQIVGYAVLGKLAFDRVAGTAHTGSVRASALDHKTIDDAMEDQAVIEAFFYKADEIVYCIGRDIRIQLCFDHIAVFHGYGYNWICHSEILLYKKYCFSLCALL